MQDTVKVGGIVFHRNHNFFDGPGTVIHITPGKAGEGESYTVLWHGFRDTWLHARRSIITAAEKNKGGK